MLYVGQRPSILLLEIVTGFINIVCYVTKFHKILQCKCLIEIYVTVLAFCLDVVQKINICQLCIYALTPRNPRPWCNWRICARRNPLLRKNKKELVSVLSVYERKARKFKILYKVFWRHYRFKVWVRETVKPYFKNSKFHI